MIDYKKTIFMCSECAITFDRKHECLTHQQKEYSGLKPICEVNFTVYMCSYCHPSRSYTSVDECLQHEREEHQAATIGTEQRQLPFTIADDDIKPPIDESELSVRTTPASEGEHQRQPHDDDDNLPADNVVPTAIASPVASSSRTIRRSARGAPVSQFVADIPNVKLPDEPPIPLSQDAKSSKAKKGTKKTVGGKRSAVNDGAPTSAAKRPKAVSSEDKKIEKDMSPPFSEIAFFIAVADQDSAMSISRRFADRGAVCNIEGVDAPKGPYDYAIVDTFMNDTSKVDRLRDTVKFSRVVTTFWAETVLDNEEDILIDNEIHQLYRPLVAHTDVKPLAGAVVSIVSYNRPMRSCLRALIERLGAACHEHGPLRVTGKDAHATYIVASIDDNSDISGDGSNRICALARQFGIPLTTHSWLVSTALAGVVVDWRLYPVSKSGDVSLCDTHLDHVRNDELWIKCSTPSYKGAKMVTALFCGSMRVDPKYIDLLMQHVENISPDDEAYEAIKSCLITTGKKT